MRVANKGKKKWNKSRRASKLTFMQLIFEDSRFKGALCYSATQHLARPNFDLLTISAISKAIKTRQPVEAYEAEIYIDGLTKGKQNGYSSEIRKSGINVRHVHRVRDENSALIRLADALAGLAREAIEGRDEEARALVKQALRGGVVREV